MVRKFSASSLIKAALPDVFSFYTLVQNLPKITPPGIGITIPGATGYLKEGFSFKLKIRLGLLWINWEVIIREFQLNKSYTDYQQRGPFKKWSHVHLFEAVTDEVTRVSDIIHYELPGGIKGKIADKFLSFIGLEATAHYQYRQSRLYLEK